MRIALVTTSFLPQIGGAELAVHHLARTWTRQGHDVVVYNQLVAEPPAGESYTVARYPLPRGLWRLGHHRFPFGWYIARHLSARLRAFEPDFVSAHFGFPTAYWLGRVRPRQRFVVTCHGQDLDPSLDGLRRRYGIDTLLAESLNGAERVVAISSLARRILEQLGVDPAKIADIPNGADLERFHEPIAEFDLRATFGLPAGGPVVLSVGRENWAKAYEVGLRAFARVAAARPEPSYVILGRGTRRLRPLVAELGLADRVRLSEGLYGPSLVAAYRQADVFFLPSRKELCPLVVPEAMAGGLPVVATDVGGSQDMVRPGVNGLLAPADDEGALAGALDRIVGDPELRAGMAQESRRLAEGYGWQQIAARYLALADPAC